MNEGRRSYLERPSRSLYGDGVDDLTSRETAKAVRRVILNLRLSTTSSTAPSTSGPPEASQCQGSLVVSERIGKQGPMSLKHSLLLTNASEEVASDEKVLEPYQRRGRAEQDFGVWETGLDRELSSGPRLKTHYRGHWLPASETKLRTTSPSTTPGPRSNLSPPISWSWPTLFARELLVSPPATRGKGNLMSARNAHRTRSPVATSG